MIEPVLEKKNTQLPDELKQVLDHEPYFQLSYRTNNILVSAERNGDNHTEWRRGLKRRRWTIDCNAKSWPRDFFQIKTATDEEQEAHYIYCSKLQLKKTTPVDIPNPNRFTLLQRDLIYFPEVSRREHVQLENSSIQKDEFLNLLKTNHEGWFHDSTLAIGFEIISRLTSCENHRIGLLTPYMAKNLADLGVAEGVESIIAFREEINVLRNKDFLFLPINDGYLLNQDDAIASTHWALVVVDCRSEVMQARYYDSLANTEHVVDGVMAQNARLCVAGAYTLLEACGRDLWAFYSESGKPFAPDVDFYTPNQNWNNGGDGDAGACGPFVWAMAKELVLYIVDLYEDEGGLPETFTLELPVEFRYFFAFDSVKTRKVLQSLIAREKRLQALKPLGTVLPIELI